MPTNPNKTYTLQKRDINQNSVCSCCSTIQWDTQRREKLLTGVFNSIEMKVKHKKLEDQIEDSPNPRKVQNK